MPTSANAAAARSATAEGYRAVAGVTAALLQPPLQARSEEGEQECDQGQQQEANDLVDASVVLPIRKGLRRTGLCAGVVPVDDECGTDIAAPGGFRRAAESDRIGRRPRSFLSC